jgi:hypothetical protein
MRTNNSGKILRATVLIAVLGLGCQKQVKLTTETNTLGTQLNVKSSLVSTYSGVTIPTGPTAYALSNAKNTNNAYTGAAVVNLTLSDDYSVMVRAQGDASWHQVPVYKTINDCVAAPGKASERRPESAASFCNFSFDQSTNITVDVMVKDLKNASTSSAKIRPLDYNIVPNTTGNVTQFSLTQNRKIDVELNGTAGRNNPLFIFANPPEPAHMAQTGGTYYPFYDQTVTDLGTTPLVLHSNDEVYIQAGAVVQGRFAIDPKATNVKFIGHGIITSGNTQHSGVIDNLFKNATFCSAGPYKTSGVLNSLWQGPTIVNSTAFVFGCMYGLNNDNSHISQTDVFKDIKEVSWQANTDAMWFDGDHNTVDDCFFFTNDDITTHGSLSCMLTNLVVWQGGNGGHLFMHFNESSSDNIMYDGVELIGVDNCNEIIKLWGDGTKTVRSVNNLTMNNIHVEVQAPASTQWANRLIKMYDTGGYTASTWTLSNFTINSPNTAQADGEGQFIPMGTETIVNGVQFKNLRYGSTQILSQSAAKMSSNSHVTGLQYLAQ